MKVNKILGFFTPIGKESGNVENFEIRGSEIPSASKLFTKLSGLFNNSERDCDIEISFVPKTGNQDNEVRDSIIKLCNKFTAENCKPLVKSLIHLTNKKIKEGLLFFIYAKDKENKKLLITRFPSEEGITVKLEGGEYIFEVIDDVFLKNSKYKAVYYQSTINDFWSGYAADKQINDTHLKEISDYWIKDFLQSELKLNSSRGSMKLAQAIRKTIAETTDDVVKEELISITPLVKNINAQALSFKSFFDKMNVSGKTREQVLTQIDNQNLCGVIFQFDSETFTKNCNYVLHILDNGAGIMAPAAEYSILWQEEAAKNGKSKYSTEGRKIDTKVRNKI